MERCPEDLLIEILSRLPVKSLICCKCVCMYWYTLIESPILVITHFNHPNNHRTRLLVNYYKGKGGGSVDSGFILCPEDYETTTLAINERLSKRKPVHEDIYNPLARPNASARPYAIADVLGPVNGLFLVHYSAKSPETYNAFLWNPATKEFWNLPAPTFNLPPNNYTYNDSAFNFGFGLDPFTNDYKVVLILFYKSINIKPSDPRPPRIAVVSVYSLAANSWRPVDNVLPSVSGIFTPRCYIVRGRNCTYQNGAYYWMSSDQGDNSVARIVMFDMVKEVFRDIEPPPCNTKKSPLVFFDLMLRNDSIAFLLSKYTATDRPFKGAGIYDEMILESIEVWIMEGEGYYWTKHLIYGPHIHVRHPFGFSRNGDLLVGTWDFRLLSYNPITRQIRDIGTERNIFKVFNYRETVAPIMPRSRKLQEVTPAPSFLPFTSSSMLSTSAVVPVPAPLSSLNILALKLGKFANIVLYYIGLASLKEVT